MRGFLTEFWAAQPYVRLINFPAPNALRFESYMKLIFLHARSTDLVILGLSKYVYFYCLGIEIRRESWMIDVEN